MFQQPDEICIHAANLRGGPELQREVRGWMFGWMDRAVLFPNTVDQWSGFLSIPATDKPLVYLPPESSDRLDINMAAPVRETFWSHFYTTGHGRTTSVRTICG